MKNGKKPTKAQKIFMKSKGLNPGEWLVAKNVDKLHIIHRTKKVERII